MRYFDHKVSIRKVIQTRLRDFLEGQYKPPEKKNERDRLIFRHLVK